MMLERFQAEKHKQNCMVFKERRPLHRFFLVKNDFNTLKKTQVTNGYPMYLAVGKTYSNADRKLLIKRFAKSMTRP